MCSRQAVSKRLLRSYTAAFLEGISWSASRSSVPKNELESGSPPPKCGPKNGTVFGALGIRALRSYTAAFLDGISWSASRSSVPKNELESGSPPPTCGPKNGTVFGALGIRANIRILPAGSKNGSQFRSRFWSHFFTLFGMHFLAFFAQNKRKTSKITISSQQAKAASTCCTRGDNDSNNIVLTMSFFGHCKGCNS